MTHQAKRDITKIMPQQPLTAITQTVTETCLRSHRDPSDVTVIGVSKRQSVAKIRTLFDAGLRDFGENYAQELLQKQTELSSSGLAGLDSIRWHFIGQLQRRKVRQIISSVAWIHSVDRIELAQEIDRHAASEQHSALALLQVKLSDEATKGGVAPESVAALLEASNALTHLRIAGLMTVPPLTEDPEQTRPYFHQLREIRDAINQRAVYKEPLTELSMGMSHDFVVAIEEGATMVRIGTLLFGERM